MTQQAYTADLVAVLEAVNALRQEMGKAPIDRLPKGTQYEPSCCPLARGLGCPAVVPMWPNAGYFKASLDEDPRALPEVLNTFGNDFDEGHYPELIDAR